ncbi:glycine/D-amino acid oxidases [Zymobacter palmae]|uniref:Glycine/D-amino acid oxidases n=1 Tax=Zymobacter palmae TaxID=33074 RepID=A0A348HHK6_9GAMM|nr:glycine/D-amino acid oxidases [Zymobacter palmae]
MHNRLLTQVEARNITAASVLLKIYRLALIGQRGRSDVSDHDAIRCLACELARGTGFQQTALQAGAFGVTDLDPAVLAAAQCQRCRCRGRSGRGGCAPGGRGFLRQCVVLGHRCGAIFGQLSAVDPLRHRYLQGIFLRYCRSGSWRHCRCSRLLGGGNGRWCDGLYGLTGQRHRTNIASGRRRTLVIYVLMSAPPVEGHDGQCHDDRKSDDTEQHAAEAARALDRANRSRTMRFLLLGRHVIAIVGGGNFCLGQLQQPCVGAQIPAPISHDLEMIVVVGFDIGDQRRAKVQACGDLFDAELLLLTCAAQQLSGTELGGGGG